MKRCDQALLNYLTNTDNFVTCDLYTFHLKDGTEWNFIDGDTDVDIGNRHYSHNTMFVTREQTKITGTPSVDTLSLTVTAAPGSEETPAGINILKMAHDGLLDDSTVELERGYFDPESNILVGVLNLYKGKIEIDSGNGILLKLTAKSKTTGLSALFPVRIYAPGNAYVLGPNGEVISSSTDEVSCAIPLKPNSNILARGIF